jgi:hypothetical protein
MTGASSHCITSIALPRHAPTSLRSDLFPSKRNLWPLCQSRPRLRCITFIHTLASVGFVLDFAPLLSLIYPPCFLEESVVARWSLDQNNLLPFHQPPG